MTHQASYAARHARRAPVFSCSDTSASYLQLQDAVAAWETFDESALENYMATGIKSLRLRIQQLSDLSRPLGEAKRKEISFMLESLLYVRSILTDDTQDFMDTVAER